MLEILFGIVYTNPVAAGVMGSEGSAAYGGVKRPERVAAVDKTEEKRKPEGFIGYRNRDW